MRPTIRWTAIQSSLAQVELRHNKFLQLQCADPRGSSNFASQLTAPITAADGCAEHVEGLSSNPSQWRDTIRLLPGNAPIYTLPVLQLTCVDIRTVTATACKRVPART